VHEALITAALTENDGRENDDANMTAVREIAGKKIQR